MRRVPIFMAMVGVMTALVALRYMPVASALTSAVVNFRGTLPVGTSAPYVACSVSPATLSIVRPKNQGATAKVTLTCTGWQSMNLTVSTGTMTPGGNTAPSTSWSAQSLALTGNGGSVSATLTITAAKNDAAGNYTYAFSVSNTSTQSGMDYSKNFSIPITLQ